MTTGARGASVLVVVPVHHAGQHLETALRSLCAQEFAGARFVLVDDGTDEDDRTLMRQFAEMDPRIRIVGGERRGLVGALELGLAERRGEAFIARFDADDVMAPDRLRRQCEVLLARPEIDVLDSGYTLLGSAGGEPPGEGMARYRRWHRTIEDDADFRREELVENPICHPAVMIRAAVLDRLGHGPIYRDGPFPEDYDLWLRLRRAGARFHKLKDELHGWRDHGHRATRTDSRYGARGFFAVKFEHWERVYGASTPRVVVWGGKQRAKPWLRALKDRGHTLVAVVEIDPAAIGRTRQGVPVVGPEALPELGADLVLIAVGSSGARALIEPVIDAAALPWVAVAGLER